MSSCGLIKKSILILRKIVSSISIKLIKMVTQYKKQFSIGKWSKSAVGAAAHMIAISTWYTTYIAPSTMLTTTVILLTQLKKTTIEPM